MSSMARALLAFLVCNSILLHFLGPVASQQQSFNTTIRNVTVDFNLFPIRSSNFGVLVQEVNGTFRSFVASASRTYLGTVRNQPGAMASALLKANGTLLCRISFENGVEWFSTNQSFSTRGNTNWTPEWPTTTISASNASAVIFVAEVGVDASYAEYVASGSTIPDTLDMVEFSVLAANVPFLRDASILHKIGKVVIRTNKLLDPYGATDTNPLLQEVRRQWNNVIVDQVGRTQQLALVVRPGAGGGLAYVGVINTSFAYSANGADDNGDFSVIWRHEAGHNWGSNHYEGGGRPEGPTIMSNNQLSRFSSSELAKILAHKSTLSLPTTAASYPRPPRANMDTASFLLQSQITIDVLANDLDANFMGLKLISAKNPSARNGKVEVRNNKIVYTPAIGVYVVDYFSYLIQNTENKTATGYVIVRRGISKS